MTEPTNAEAIKATIRAGYGQIARGSGSCCGGQTACGSAGTVNFGPGYDGVAGYEPEADLGLGCGLPTVEAAIVSGETVLDLGSGAGNDVFIAAKLVGSDGRVIGLDMTEDMVTLARRNAERLGHRNVEFVLGEIEHIPLPEGEVDLVLSNCVLNLVPNKAAAFAEIHRVLKPGGRFALSDVVLEGQLPAGLAAASELYVACVAGALQREEYLAAITGAGFEAVQVRQSHEIALPAALVAAELGQDGAEAFQASGVRILSVTLTGRRAGALN
jgi:SAM-dependent methyltransferase